MAQRFDRSAKVFGEEDVRGMLYLFAGIPLEDRVHITPIDRDLALPGMLVAQGLSLKFQLPVRSILVLLTSRGCPERPPRVCVSRSEHTVFRHRFEIVPLWKQRAAPIVRLARKSLQPWVLLMRPNDREAQRAADIIGGDRDLASQYLTLGRLNERYDRAKLLEMLGRLQPMILRDEILEQSDFIQYFKKKGLDQGREAGLAEGRVEGARDLLRLLLRERFKGLENRPELKRLTEIGQIERLTKKIVAAKDREAVLALLRRIS
jgi:hypothetical protein